MLRFYRLLPALALLVATGCGTTEPAEPTDLDGPVALQTLADIDPYMAEALRSFGSVALAAAVVKGERLVWSGGVGQASRAAGTPATSESIFLVASVSKTVVAAAVMQLVESGRINLDADISTCLPFRVQSPAGVGGITARQLLRHTSGITDAHCDEVAGDLYTYGSDSPLALGDFLASMFVPGGRLYDASTYGGTAPDTAYVYTNLGVALLGYVAEAASGVPLDTLTRTRIFEPLGMTRTAWRLADLPAAALAMPYSAERTPYGHYTFPDYPDGGLRTSVDDLSKFLRAVANGGALGGARILQPASVAEMLHVQYPAVSGAERPAMLPVETLGGWAAVFTGETGARSGVPGNEWFERETLAAYAPVPLSVRAVRQTLGIYTDDLFGRTIATPTLFERAGVRSHVALGFVHRGADVLSTPDPSDIGDVLNAAFHLVAGRRGAVYSVLDDDTVAGVRWAFRRHGVPDLQVAYLPGGDVLLMARDGTEAAPDGTVVDITENRYYFGSPRRSGHGSATARDGLIPLVLAHPQRMGTTLRARMTGAVGPAPMQLDVTGLILALLAE